MSIDPSSRAALPPASARTASGEPIVVPGVDAPCAQPPSHRNLPPDWPPAAAQRPELGVVTKWAQAAEAAAAPFRAGIDVFTQFSFSAVLGGYDFKQTAQEKGIDLSTLGAADRHRIDDAMRERFLDAGRTQKVPVLSTTAKKWLEEELTLLTK